MQNLEFISQLTGGIAHDFNNLLMIIQGNLQLLARQFQPQSKDMRRIEAAIKATENATNLTQRLLAFSRKQPLSPMLMQVQEYKEVTELIKPLLGNNIDVNVTIAADAWSIYIDRCQFENAIVNIVINAKDAIKDTGQIDIDIHNVTIDEATAKAKQLASGSYVEVTIKDNGSGMPPHILNRVFEPFFTTKAQGQGTGLGLSMVYGFVQRSQGFIDISSQLYQGTTLSLYFPKSAENLKKQPKAQHENSVVLGDETILVVEDEEALLNLTSDYLNHLGYKTLLAKTGHSALAILKKQKVDLLFTDIIMPGLVSGPQLANQAKKMQPRIKLLLTTGYPKNNLRGRDLKKFEPTLLVKPYKMDELGYKVREILDS